MKTIGRIILVFLAMLSSTGALSWRMFDYKEPVVIPAAKLGPKLCNGVSSCTLIEAGL